MSEPYILKYNGDKIPIYKTPFTHEDYQQILYSHIRRFGVHDQKSGKIKQYNFDENRLPTQNSIFQFDFNMFSYFKILSAGVVAYWAYKIATVGKLAKNKTKEHINKVDKAVKGWENLSRWKSPVGEENGSLKDQGSVSSPNGWTVSKIIPEVER